MEGVCAVLSCLLVALASALATGCMARLPPRVGRLHRPHLAQAVVERMELLGHWVPLIRLSNAPVVVEPSERLRMALVSTPLAMTRRACVAFACVCVVSAGAVGTLVSLSPIGAAVGVAMGFAALGLFVGRSERVARDRAAAQMPEVLRSLAAALSVGKSLPQAIEHVGRNVGEPLGTEFLKASFEIKSGRTVDAAVASLCSRVETPGMALLGTSLQISQRTGSSLNELFARTALMVSDGVALRRELSVKTSQVRLSARIVASMPVLLAAALVLLSADYRAGLAMPAGRLCLGVAVLLDISALWFIRRQMKGVIP